jgi:hypothetical protein
MSLRKLLFGETLEERDARWANESRVDASSHAAQRMLRDVLTAMSSVQQYGFIADGFDQHVRRHSVCRARNREHGQDFTALPRGAGERKTSVLIVTSDTWIINEHVKWLFDELQNAGCLVEDEYYAACCCTTLMVSWPTQPVGRGRHARR